MNYAYFVRICVETGIPLEWADKQNPYIILEILRQKNKLRGNDENKIKRKATAADMKDFVR